ncbi:hypothetical protein [Streptomyces sp. NPDC055506]
MDLAITAAASDCATVLDAERYLAALADAGASGSPAVDEPVAATV